MAFAGQRVGTRLAAIAVRRRAQRTAAPLVRLGTEYGGWTIPAGWVDSSWTCYTAGVGEDASFDLALVELGCEVVAIDPTPRAIDYVTPMLAEHPNLAFAPYALWSSDCELEFFPPANREHVSFSATNRQRTTDPIRVDARTLGSIMAERGHGKVDLLKMDIEGAEYPVLESLDLGGAGVRVLCVEFHNDHGVRALLHAIRAIERRGFDVVATHRTDVTFVRAGFRAGEAQSEP